MAPVELNRWLNFWAFDIVGEVSFSRPFGFLKESRDIGNACANGRTFLYYLSFIGRAYWMHKFLMANPLLGWLGLQPTNHLETTSAAIEVRKSILDNGKQAERPNDMIDEWMKHGLSQHDIFCASISSVATGSDTVSATIQSFFYHMQVEYG